MFETNVQKQDIRDVLKSSILRNLEHLPDCTHDGKTAYNISFPWTFFGTLNEMTTSPCATFRFSYTATKMVSQNRGRLSIIFSYRRTHDAWTSRNLRGYEAGFQQNSGQASGLIVLHVLRTWRRACCPLERLWSFEEFQRAWLRLMVSGIQMSHFSL